MLYALNFLLGIAGAAITILIREVVANAKNNNNAKWVAQVALSDELKSNYENLTRRNKHGKTLNDYIQNNEIYLFGDDFLLVNNWNETKLEIVRLHPKLGKDLFKLYSIIEELKKNGDTSNLRKDVLDELNDRYEQIKDELEL
ncbi:hypothetical protein [Aquibacillus saliphilus]|uniref:hypothetical protein n=1 Tax=Aquibacillus saliphilus TaxID=1909422 RepID=UPI001CF0123C|nr:hypothetical protein [Aquibacillus saliphilus]